MGRWDDCDPAVVGGACIGWFLRVFIKPGVWETCFQEKLVSQTIPVMIFTALLYSAVTLFSVS